MNMNNEIFSARVAMRYILAFFLVCLPSFQAVADVLDSSHLSPEMYGCARHEGHGQGCVKIKGDINWRDVQSIKSLIKSGLLGQGAAFYLDSKGGSVVAALEIGRIMRDLRAVALVLADHTCASACVFLLIGGSERIIAGKVIIHRPYLGSVDASAQNVNETYRLMVRHVNQYLADMNVDTSLYNAMVKVPPEDGMALSKYDLAKFNILKLDPVEEEIRDLDRAREHNLNRADQLKRKKMVSTTCDPLINGDNPQNYYACKTAIYSGRPYPR